MPCLNTILADIFPPAEFVESSKFIPLLDMKHFQINEISWSSIANFVTMFYYYCRTNADAFAHVFRLDDILDKKQSHQLRAHGCDSNAIADCNANDLEHSNRNIPKISAKKTAYSSDDDFQSGNKILKVNKAMVANSLKRKKDRETRRAQNAIRNKSKQMKRQQQQLAQQPVNTFGSIEMLFKLALPNIYA